MNIFHCIELLISDWCTLIMSFSYLLNMIFYLILIGCRRIAVTFVSGGKDMWFCGNDITLCKHIPGLVVYTTQAYINLIDFLSETNFSTEVEIKIKVLQKDREVAQS